MERREGRICVNGDHKRERTEVSSVARNYIPRHAQYNSHNSVSAYRTSSISHPVSQPKIPNNSRNKKTHLPPPTKLTSTRILPDRCFPIRTIPILPSPGSGWLAVGGKRRFIEVFL